MAVRSDLSVDWETSPRVITIAAPSTEITIQDLYDTLRWIEQSPDGMTHPILISAGGKEPLGGATYVGITATLQNAVLAFEDRPGPSWVLCTISGGNLVAVDDSEPPEYIDPRHYTAYTTVDRVSSSSATLVDVEVLPAIETGVLDVLGITGQNVVWSSMAFDANHNLTAATITQYTDPTLTTPRKAWTVTATYNASNELTAYSLTEA